LREVEGCRRARHMQAFGDRDEDAKLFERHAQQSNLSIIFTILIHLIDRTRHGTIFRAIRRSSVRDAPLIDPAIPAARPVPGRWDLMMGAVRRLTPGVTLCVLVSAAAAWLQMAESALFGQAWLESLVLAILLGTAVRTAWKPGARWSPGIQFSAKMLLEIAVMLLGASISARIVASAGVGLLLGILGVVAVAIPVSYGIARLFGLPWRMSVLIACGNSICGNSAIAAVAPLIGAESDDVATAIAFTAVLGVGVVLGLPVLAGLLHLSNLSFGVFAGLTVYAVPQVLAATAPVSALSVQMGTLVKLIRVLTLGPVCLVVTLMRGRTGSALSLHRLVPWFILGFLALATLRSADLLPERLLAPSADLSTMLMIIGMAALGLGVDLRTVAKAGPRVTAVVTLSLVLLGAVALLLIRALDIA
jgi:uncharacterized integral membrane protein (TIGR00698 family)